MDGVRYGCRFVCWVMLAAIAAPAHGQAALPSLGLVDEESGPSVTIVSPPEGHTFTPDEAIVVSYRADPGDKGKYIHVEVNGEERGVMQAEGGGGEQHIGQLEPGEYQITLRLVNQAHADVGAKSSIRIRVAREPVASP